MSSSLTVLKIENYKNHFKNGIDFSIKKDSTLEDHGVVVQKLGLPLTEVHYNGRDDEYYKYSIKFSTKTIDKPIYIYGEGVEEYSNGFQEIEHFDVFIDVNMEFLYIFTSKKIAKPFKTRLEKFNYMKTSNYIFDFSKLQELTNFISGYGLWEDVEGIIKKAGKFGHGIENTIDDFSVITTFYIDYKYKNRQVQLILNSEGRISTNNDLNNNDLLFLFNEIKNTLIQDTL